MATITETRYVLAVHNLKASAAYYGDILGFTITECCDPGWLFFNKDNCHIMVGECPDAMPAKDTQAHSYFAYMVVADIDSYYQIVSSKGAELIKPIKDESWGMREFGVRTPDGHRIMFGAPIK